MVLAAVMEAAGVAARVLRGERAGGTQEDLVSSLLKTVVKMCSATHPVFEMEMRSMKAMLSSMKPCSMSESRKPAQPM